MIRQCHPRGSARLSLLGAGALFVVLASCVVAGSADGRSDKDALPPKTIKFRPPGATTAKNDNPPACSYVTTDKAPEPWSHNSGAFVCDKEGGTATYREGGKPFNRKLTWSKIHTSEGGNDYYFYDEPKVGADQRTWALEVNRNDQGNWTIYYKVNDGPFTFFQLADQGALDQ